MQPNKYSFKKERKLGIKYDQNNKQNKQIQKYIVIENKDTVKLCPPPKSNYNPKLNHSIDRNLTK